MNEEPLVNPEVVNMVGDWKGYVEAKLGFRNHWYPVRFSKEIDEGQIEVIELLGEKLLLKRIDGKVYAMRDRCLHRGVPLSRKPDCYTRDTITCWYHGYTYRFQTGELVNILAVPDSRLIGRRKIVTYPVQEAKGLIFVFLGDEDEVHDLRKDVPPGFLDEDLMVLGKHRIVDQLGVPKVHPAVRYPVTDRDDLDLRQVLDSIVHELPQQDLMIETHAARPSPIDRAVAARVLDEKMGGGADTFDLAVKNAPKGRRSYDEQGELDT